MVHVYENDRKRSNARNCSCPASLFSVDGKIFEKLPNNRFVNHIKKCGLFSKFHYGFRFSQLIADLLPDASKNFASLPHKLKSNGTFLQKYSTNT